VSMTTEIVFVSEYQYQYAASIDKKRTSSHRSYE